ncbi:alginate O-acetyltransferase AlgX-related protein [Dankookia sp. P2]|uniref:alginate O-acetyltransferase AlgX-related protein n=1 Tax=Dankookia sp. P2 TaxID=3423955 RepID=UPI003D66FD9B
MRPPLRSRRAAGRDAGDERRRGGAEGRRDRGGAGRRSGQVAALSPVPAGRHQAAGRYRQALPAILAALRKPGALAVDLDTPFRAVRASRPKLPVYFATDTHWTPGGAEVAATKLAKRMKEDLRLPPAPRPAARLGPRPP